MARNPASGKGSGTIPTVPEPRQAREGAAVRVRGSAEANPDRSRGTVGGAGGARRTGAGWPFFNRFRVEFLTIKFRTHFRFRTVPTPPERIESAGREMQETETFWIIDDRSRAGTAEPFCFKGGFFVYYG
jgi:hypothetical protein